MKKMRQLLKRLIVCMMCLLCIPIQTVEALSVDQSLTGITYFLTHNGETQKYLLSYKSYQEHPAYCIEPEVQVGHGDVYEQTELDKWKDLSVDIKKKIFLASALGYGYKDRTEQIYYAASQQIIWELLGNQCRWDTDAEKIAKAVEEIRTSMRAYDKKLNWKVTDMQSGKVLAGPSETITLKECEANHIYHFEADSTVLSIMKLKKVEGFTITDSRGKEVDKSSVFTGDFYAKIPNEKECGEIVFETDSENKLFMNIPIILHSEQAWQKLIVTGNVEKRVSQICMNVAEQSTEVVKTDETGNILEGASLCLKEQGGKIIEEWISDSKAHIVKLDKDKTYVLEEREAPAGYYCQNMTFQAGEKNRIELKDPVIHCVVSKIDQDGKAVKGATLSLYDVTNGDYHRVEMNDSQGNPWVTDGTERDISKYVYAGHTYAIVEEDVSLEYFLAEEARFTIPKYPTEEQKKIVVTIVDSKIIYHFAKVDENGEPVEDAELAIFDMSEDGKEVYRFVTGKEPEEVGLLKRGHTYRLVETRTPDGKYTMIEKTFKVPEYGNGAITITGQDPSIVYYAMKKDQSGNPVEGASMVVYEKTDKGEMPVQTFRSTKEPVRLVGLCAGHSYVLREEESPTGYFKAEDVIFDVPEHGTSEPVIIEAIDYVIEWKIRKEDSNHNRLVGVKLAVYEKETEEKVGEWITESNQDIEIGMYLRAGETYILREEAGIEGYYQSEDISFTVPLSFDGKEETVIHMVDQAIDIHVHKTDLEGKAIAGAELLLLDAETAEVIYTWKTTKDAMEIGAYVKAGKDYVIKEKTAPVGYYYAADLTFSVPLYPMDAISLSLQDNPIRYQFLKTDEKGNVVTGVKLRLVDKTDGKTREEWTTGHKAYEVKEPLCAGHTYELSETDWKNGVHGTASIQFTVPTQSNEKLVTITMVDDTVGISFAKIDQNGVPLAGAKLQILNAEHAVVAELCSTSDRTGVREDVNGKKISEMLKGGETYYLHEVEAPFGYELAEDIAFTVEGTGDSPQCIMMCDKARPIFFEIEKVDKDNTDLPLKDCEFTVYYADTSKPALDRYGKEAIYKTDENGKIQGELLYHAGGYYLKETKAPDGYVSTGEKIILEQNGNNGFDESNPIGIRITNDKKTPATYDNLFYGTFVSVFGFSLIAIAGGLLVRYLYIKQ